MSKPLERFLALYANLSHYSPNKLAEVYSEDVAFVDPVSAHHGLDSVNAYFKRMLLNCQFCIFEIQSSQALGDTGHVSWTMRFQHRHLRGGKPIEVQGFSLLNFERGRINRQQDYYDMGAMIYEHVPVLGPIVSALRRRLAA
ncbi:MAG: nuclear transport factor 2 family protein [Pseudomonadota bacterium]